MAQQPLEQPDVDPATIRRWQQELAQLESRHSDATDKAVLWLEEIRSEIYRYLLKRYGAMGIGSQSLDDIPHGPQTPNRSASGANPGWRATSTRSGWAKPARSRKEMKGRLGRIAKHNAPRHRRYESERRDALWHDFLANEELGQFLALILMREIQEGTAGVIPQEEFAHLILDEILSQNG